MPNLDPAEIRLDDDRLYGFLEQFLTDEKLARFDQTLQRRTRFLTAVFENVDKDHNVSACIRSCECFGLQDVHLLGARDAVSVNREISTGAGQWMTVHTQPIAAKKTSPAEIEAYYATMRADGYRIVATSPAEGAVSLADYEPDQPTALVFGTEMFGLSDAAIEQADACVKIPMHGLTRSFNLSVSVALCLYELRRTIDQSGHQIALASSEKKQLRKIWMRQAIGYKFESYLRRYDAEYGQ